jgi:hypothetical protein
LGATICYILMIQHRVVVNEPRCGATVLLGLLAKQTLAHHVFMPSTAVTTWIDLGDGG